MVSAAPPSVAGVAPAPEREGAADVVASPHATRRLALLGGTTTRQDFLLALRLLMAPERLVEGEACAAFERAFARTTGTAHAISFAAGRVGLYGLLQALNVGPGDEVLVQVPTHIVVANAIRYAGARPVFVDCRRDSYNIDLEQAERLLSPRTRALILQHTFGVPVEMDRALSLARTAGIPVIEDCVHALGATYGGRPAGSLGDAAFFSTEETKTISTTMGGMVVTSDEALAARMRDFQQSCAPPPAALTARYVLKFALYYLLTEPRVHRHARALYERLGRRHPLPRPTEAAELRGARPAGYLRRLSQAQAVLGLAQLRGLQRNLAHRAATVENYRTRLEPLGLPLPVVPEGAEPAYVRLPLWVPDREAAVRATAPHAVLGTWFTSVLEEAESPAVAGYVPGSCPVAEAAARHLINLPTHPRVTEHDVATLTLDLARALPSSHV